MKIEIKFEEKRTNSYDINLNELNKMHFNTKVAIITNPKVSGLHLKTLLDKISADELYIITVGDGEFYKNQESVNLILENLLNHRFDRKSLLIAFGGGVIGDMSGYVASIFQRGIEFIQIPTTLLSQVDASVGGKTGINTKFGKNLIGAFHQPKAVYIETDFLKTLPSREFGAGVAEIVKMAVTFDRDFFEWLEKSDLHKESDLLEAIQKSVKLKADVVAKDEKEQGLRAVLNYGHTFAHVIESETKYTKYLHGETVAIGINMANRLALSLGLMSEDEVDRVASLLARYNLPLQYNIKDIDSFYEGFFLDKKTFQSKIKFILSKGLGDFKVTDNTPKEVVLSVLEEFNKDV
jgi:3-dehydroquinate synthase